MHYFGLFFLGVVCGLGGAQAISFVDDDEPHPIASCLTAMVFFQVIVWTLGIH